MATQTYKVAILQRRLVQYRLTLFERLRSECASRGIDLHLVYGQASAADEARKDGGALPWADEVNARWVTVAGVDLVWQPLPSHLRNSDLIIMTQENKILSNYRLLLRRALGRNKLGYWGHGVNLQSTAPEGLRERFKALLTTKIDWWFAYTQGTVDILTKAGYPADQITQLDNAIDDEKFLADLATAEADLDTLNSLRAEIDLADGAPLGLYCGALYKEKRVDQLIEAAARIHQAIPGFRLVVIGDGPDRPQLEQLMADKPWARCVGVQTGVDKAAWFRLASVQLTPGAVGLHVLDSFLSGVPLITTRSALHGPEVDYLDHGVNGLLTDDSIEAFADEVIALLNDSDRYELMVEAGHKAAKHYTLANMVANFADGIEAALQRT